MKKLYIIASVTDGVGLEIEVFYEPGQVTRRMKALVDSGFRKPNKDETPEDYHGSYYDWIRESNDNMCETDIALHIEDLEDQAPATLPAQPAAVEAPAMDDDQMALLLALKTWRKDQSATSGKPEAMIFQNAVLETIAREKPGSLTDLAKIKGMGPHKIDLYANDLLAIIGAFN